MTANQLVPAAQYLPYVHRTPAVFTPKTNPQQFKRMQSFTVSRLSTTYSDPAKSELVLKHRTGLRQLLQDVRLGHSSLPGHSCFTMSAVGAI